MTVNESCVSVEMFSGQQFSLLKIDPLNTFWGGCISKKKKQTEEVKATTNMPVFLGKGPKTHFV